MKTSLVGFFDILGTRDSVMSERFSDTDALEFVNPIGIAASFTPNVRFAVFSDSLIVSAEPKEIRPLLRAINFMYGNWFSEMIYVRGAISSGDIHWVADSTCDAYFKRRPNLTYARVYGKGLVTAYGLEQKSGPGAICFLSGKAAELFRKVEGNSVLDGHTPMLSWATKRQAKILDGYASISLECAKRDTDAWRHAKATKHFCSTVVAKKLFLPDAYAS
jgi:hypothetical protein